MAVAVAVGSPRVNVAVLICTHGSNDWLLRGQETWRQHKGCAEWAFSHHLSDGTIAESRNSAARGVSDDVDWLCFLDADDCVRPGYFDAMQTAFERWDVHHYRGNMEAGVPVAPAVLLSPAVEYVDELGNVLHRAHMPNRQHAMTELNHCVIGTLIPRRVFEKVGGFPELPVYEDWALFLAAIRAGCVIVDVPDAVYVATQHRPGTSRNTPDRVLQLRTYQQIKDEHLRLCGS